MGAGQLTCFQEADPELALWRRAGAEAVGTFLLVMAGSCAGSAALKGFAGLPGLVLPVTAVVLAGALIALIIALGSVSGGHFNPLITILQWVAGERGGACMLAYVGAQLAAGAAGGLIASWLWQAPLSDGGGLGWAGLPGELLASAGLMIIVFGCARSGRTQTGPFAVGAWLVAGVIAMPTTSYANPAVVLGALLTGGPLALGPKSGLPYLTGELVGALIALAAIGLLFPKTASAR